jgi:hypothetical protein
MYDEEAILMDVEDVEADCDVWIDSKDGNGIQ